MKIGIDLGHGVGSDRGAADGFILEETIIDAVGPLVIKGLVDLGHEVLETRPTQATTVADSLIQRVDKANNYILDLFVSIHANAGGGQGSEVFTFGGKELVQARNVLNNLVGLGFIDRGIKGSNLYVTNYTNAPAMLIEICFTDTRSDVDLYNSIGAEAIANAIVEGITGDTVIVNTKQNDWIGQVQSTCAALQNWVSKLQTECNVQGFSTQAVDGIPGTNTLAGCPTLKIGSQGNITGLLQQKLDIISDGIFGSITEQKVKEFQAANGLVADGIVGPNTWRALLGL